jgi:hypothetical protein
MALSRGGWAEKEDPPRFPLPITVRLRYLGTMVEQFIVERVQTGVRMEKRILKVLKGLAEYHDMSLGDLLEGIVLHVFEGKTPFGSDSLRKIAALKEVYGLDLDASASHQLREKSSSRARRDS